MEEIIIITKKIPLSRIKELAEKGFGDMVKGVVDLDKKIIAFNGELHADEEAALIEQGSKQQSLWGFNVYPDEAKDTMIEYASMINIRPKQGNNSRFVEDKSLQKQIATIVFSLMDM